jgi:hypothetical protein
MLSSEQAAALFARALQLKLIPSACWAASAPLPDALGIRQTSIPFCRVKQ